MVSLPCGVLTVAVVIGSFCLAPGFQVGPKSASRWLRVSSQAGVSRTAQEFPGKRPDLFSKWDRGRPKCGREPSHVSKMARRRLQNVVFWYANTMTSRWPQEGPQRPVEANCLLKVSEVEQMIGSIVFSLKSCLLVFEMKHV